MELRARILMGWLAWGDRQARMTGQRFTAQPRRVRFGSFATDCTDATRSMMSATLPEADLDSGGSIRSRWANCQNRDDCDALE
jgi:hypothetical protein